MPRSRLFFALWPDAALRAALHAAAQALQRDCGGRLVEAANIHQTLVFIGNAEAGRMNDVAGQALAAGIDAFALEFGVTGYWRHNRIVWAAPRATPEPLLRLVDALRRHAGEAGVSIDGRAFAAHVTLIRDARRPAALPSLAFTWEVRDLALIGSAPGERSPRYEVLNRWSLRQ